MTRFIFTMVIFCFIISCNRKSEQIDSRQVKLNDTLQNQSQSNMDTTEIDFVVASPGNAKIVLENEYVRVIEYSLRPGEKDNPHTHPAKTSYVISGGTLRVYPENEKPFEAEEVKGTVEWADKRGKHYVENIGETTVTILLTEIKSVH